MTRTIFSMMLLFCAIAFVQGQDRSLFVKKEYIGFQGDTLRYRLLYPEKQKENKSYPLILFLHGSGESGSNNESQLANGGNMFLDSFNREKYPAFVFVPQCPRRQSWARMPRVRLGNFTEGTITTEGDPTPVFQLVMEVLNKITVQEKVDISRIYVMGLSLGGFGTYDALARFPDKFAAAVPICGGGNPNVVDRYAKNVAIWIFHGDADPAVSCQYSREMYKALKNAGANVKYTEYPGVKHQSWEVAFADPELFKWMFAQKKPKSVKK